MKRIFLSLAVLMSATSVQGMEMGEKPKGRTLRKIFLEQRLKGAASLYIWSLSYSPDAQRLAVGINETVKIWDIQQQKYIHRTYAKQPKI